MVGERICRALGGLAEGSTTFVSVRVGWCQPGRNLPETLNATGDPGAAGAGAEGHPDPEGLPAGGALVSPDVGSQTGTSRISLIGP